MLLCVFRCFIAACYAVFLVTFIPLCAARSLDGFWESKSLSEVLFVQKDYYTIYQLTGPTTLIRERGVVYDLQQRAVELSRDVANEMSITFVGELFPTVYQRASSDVVRRLRSRSVLEPARSAVLEPEPNVSVFLDVVTMGLSAGDAGVVKSQKDKLLKDLPQGSVNSKKLFQRLCAVLEEGGDDLGSLRRADGTLCLGSPQSDRALLDTWKMFLERGGKKETAATLKTLRYAVAEHVNQRLLEGQAVFGGNRKIAYGALPSGVGWIGILDLEGLSGRRDPQEDARILQAVLSEAFAALRYSSALVLDMRLSTGGAAALALDLVSRFANSTRLAFLVPDDKAPDLLKKAREISLIPSLRSGWAAPVVILTSSLTGGAAEVAALAMRDMPGITVVGSATRGELAWVRRWILPNGWTGTMSRGRMLSTDGTAFQGRGIPPDVEISPARVDTFLDDLVDSISLSVVEAQASP